MAKPVGVERKRKNNDNKHAHVREEWTKGKKLGRPKQVWVGCSIFAPAHWEKVQ